MYQQRNAIEEMELGLMRVSWGGKIKNEKVDIQLGFRGKPQIQVHKYPKVLPKYYSMT